MDVELEANVDDLLRREKSEILSLECMIVGS